MTNQRTIDRLEIEVMNQNKVSSYFTIAGSIRLDLDLDSLIKDVVIIRFITGNYKN